MSGNIPASVLADAGLVQLPTADRLASIYAMAADLAKLELEIADKTAELQRLQDDRNKLACVQLPKLFDEVSVDRLGVPGFNADIELITRVHANISAEWEEDRRERGFAELERLNAEDMIRIGVTVKFGKNEYEKAADFVRHVRGLNWLGGREIEIRKGVPWQTLKKWLEEQLEKHVPVKLDLIGGSLTRTCNIKWRKTK